MKANVFCAFLLVLLTTVSYAFGEAVPAATDSPTFINVHLYQDVTYDISVIGSYVEGSDNVIVDLSTLSVDELLFLQDLIKSHLTTKGHKTYVDIERGSKGDDVVAIQERLTELGFYSGNITGKFDSETQRAFKAFEKYNNLFSDGFASRADQVILFNPNSLAKATPAPSPTTIQETMRPDTSKPDFSLEITSCWAPNTGLNGVTLYSPYLKIRVTNQRGREATQIIVDAVFYNESTKELWDDETYYLISSGDTALKNGYSKTAFVRSSVGYQSKIPVARLPTITAEISINGTLYDCITITNVYE